MPPRRLSVEDCEPRHGRQLAALQARSAQGYDSWNRSVHATLCLPMLHCIRLWGDREIRHPLVAPKRIQSCGRLAVEVGIGMIPAYPSTISATTRPRLILVDDHRMVVRGLVAVLEGDFEIVATAHDGAELMHLLPVASDCLLLDLQMPGRSGLQLIPEIVRLQPTLRILVVSMLVDRVMADACLCAGAGGFIPKDADVKELRWAVREVMAGRRYLSPLVPKSSHRVGLAARHSGLHLLTERQERIVLMMGDGQSGVDIGNELGIRPSTVTFHKRNIARILGIDNDAALLRYAVLASAGMEESPSGAAVFDGMLALPRGYRNSTEDRPTRR